MPEHGVFDQELRVAEQLARQAGAIVVDYYHRGAEISWKGQDDPVTAADRAANSLLVSGLRSAYPQDGILAEESLDDAARLARQRVWMVDPLDGTREFIGHIGEFSIMIGLAVAGAPVLGVVYQPVDDVLYRAVVGGSAEIVLQGLARPLAVSQVGDPATMRLVASRSHRDPLVDAVAGRLGIVQERPSGSVGLKIGLLATAQCDVYIHPSPGLKEWDTCAPHAILLAAGGAISDAWGRPLSYNKPDVRQRQGLVATNGRIHARVVAETAEAAEMAGYRVDSGFW